MNGLFLGICLVRIVLLVAGFARPGLDLRSSGGATLCPSLIRSISGWSVIQALRYQTHRLYACVISPKARTEFASPPCWRRERRVEKKASRQCPGCPLNWRPLTCSPVAMSPLCARRLFLLLPFFFLLFLLRRQVRLLMRRRRRRLRRCRRRRRRRPRWCRWSCALWLALGRRRGLRSRRRLA